MIILTSLRLGSGASQTYARAMATVLSDPTGDRSVRHLHRVQPVVITDAREASSHEMSSRVRHYTIAMAFRMACFLGMVVVDGWLRWTLLALAVFLPYVAVLLANQADDRSTGSAIVPGAPEAAPQLAAAPFTDTIDGEVVSDSEDHLRGAA